MPGPNSDADFEPQDQAESFDETNLGQEDAAESPEVEDLTRAVGDRDDDEALALDAGEFTDEVVGDADLEEDDELAYRAATEEREDDLDGLGAEDAFDEDRLDRRSQIEGLADEVRDADAVVGGEDDFTNFQSKALDDDDLKRLGYAKAPDQPPKRG